MNFFNEFVDWFRKKDENIVATHLKKDREALKKELADLETEYRRMQDFLHRLEAIIEKEEELAAEFAGEKEGGENHVD